ncbi:hypothetical protein ASE63_18525 [Bosea sp. Root381]|uniref:hypothetical protein n=1 Tax=Bosea sp. Root381 TaxID=1736524 RepID=UPI0006F56438|nr:hypothetical protein [Bosea sp. Root381]KRE13469.1 hypothetical protein ASE63_18525 [Bosea sp. Root381]
MSAAFEPGWHLVRTTEGSTAVLWCKPYPLPGPFAWVIAGRTREACASVTTAAFVAELTEFRTAMLIASLGAPAVFEQVGGRDGR